MRSKTEDFRSFWQDTLTAPAHEATPSGEVPYEGCYAPEALAEAVSPHFEEDDLFLTTNEDFLGILQKIPLAKAGGEDGLLGEFVRALSPDQQGVLFQLLKRVLAGVEEMPQSWKHATVTLIPKMLRALTPKYFRPITVLPVAQKLALRLWLAEVKPYLQLRRGSSHGFRAGFQAAELVVLIRTLHEKIRRVEFAFFRLQARR